MFSWLITPLVICKTKSFSLHYFIDNMNLIIDVHTHTYTYIIGLPSILSLRKKKLQKYHVLSTKYHTYSMVNKDKYTELLLFLVKAKRNSILNFIFLILTCLIHRINGCLSSIFSFSSFFLFLPVCFFLSLSLSFSLTVFSS